MEYLKYRIYANETIYTELVFTNENYIVEMGLLGNNKSSDYRHSLTIRSANNENIKATNKFILNTSKIVNGEQDIYKIEIDILRSEETAQHLVFNKGEFKNLNLIYFNDTQEQNVRLVCEILAI